MISHYCKYCNKVTGFKRNIGMGTLIGGLVTLGISLLAIPLYPLRCVACGNELSQMDNDDDLNLNVVETVVEGMIKNGIHIGLMTKDLRMSHQAIEQIGNKLYMMGKINKDQFRKTFDKFPAEQAPTQTQAQKPENKKCPFCAEEIKFEAIKCKHCGSSLIQTESE